MGSLRVSSKCATLILSWDWTLKQDETNEGYLPVLDFVYLSLSNVDLKDLDII